MFSLLNATSLSAGLKDGIGWLMIGILCIFLLFLALGAGFGVLRGGRRSTIRLITVVVALIMALLLTPAFSKAALGMTIPGLKGQSAGSFIEDAITKGSLGASIAERIPDIVSFAKACAVVVVNFIMFYTLFIAFNIISWIVYFFLARKFAPKSKKSETDGTFVATKRHRLIGLGVGLATGLVFFTFFMIPVLGTMQTLDKAARYTPTFASFDAKNLEKLADETKEKESDSNITEAVVLVFNITTDINTQVQGSAMGKITKYTGIQGVGGWGMSYLSTVRMDKKTVGVKTTGVKSVNLRNDFIKFTHVAKDAAAILVELDREGEMIDKVENLKSSDYKALQKMVDNIFDIKFVHLVFGYSELLVDVFEDDGTLDSSINGLGDYSEKDDEFKPAVYEVIRTFTKATKLRDDLKNSIEIARLFFAKGDANAGFFYDIKGIINEKDAQKASAAAEAFAVKLEGTDKKNANANKLTKAFFDLNLVRALFGGEDLSALYRVPVADALKMENPKDVVFVADAMTDAKWNQVSKDAGQLLVDLVRSASCITTMVNGEGKLEERIEAMDVVSLGGVLNTLTNSKGIGTFTRALIVKYIGDLENNDDFSDSDGFNTDAIFGKIKAKLETDAPIDWVKELETIKSMAIFIIGMGDLNDLTAEDLKKLLKSIGDSELLADIALDLINDMLFDIGIQFNVDDAYIGDFLGILGDTAETLVKLFNEDSEMNPEDADDLLAMLGGGDGVLSKLADLNSDIISKGGEPIGIDVTGLGIDEADFDQALAEGYTPAEAARIKAMFKGFA